MLAVIGMFHVWTSKGVPLLIVIKGNTVQDTLGVYNILVTNEQFQHQKDLDFVKNWIILILFVIYNIVLSHCAKYRMYKFYQLEEISKECSHLLL